MCFTCRRVKAQMDVLQTELPILDKNQSIAKAKLSEDAKARIKSKIQSNE